MEKTKKLGISKKKTQKTPVKSVSKITPESEYVTLSMKGLSLPWAILLGVFIFTAGIGSAIYFGLKARPVTTTTTDTNAAPTYAANEFAEVSIPYVAGPLQGDKNAKVVILEFSDLVCPYCQKFHNESYQDILQNYINTGKAALLYKHYPLSFHNPAATIAAKASYCIESLYGDEKMFEFNDAFFLNSGTMTQNAYDKSNNPVINLKDKEFYALIGKISGVDSGKVKTCMNSQAALDRLASDEKELTDFQTDITSKGLSQGLGTPSFVIGTVKDGVLTGRLIEGAYPMIAFTNVIEEQLKK
ncbi:thioredoxin domain-containing protein [bacterium]|nr:thioredoxin domain-containing protein [bacterium]